MFYLVFQAAIWNNVEMFPTSWEYTNLVQYSVHIFQVHILFIMGAIHLFHNTEQKNKIVHTYSNLYLNYMR